MFPSKIYSTVCRTLNGPYNLSSCISPKLNLSESPSMGIPRDHRTLYSPYVGSYNDLWNFDLSQLSESFLRGSFTDHRTLYGPYMISSKASMTTFFPKSWRFFLRLVPMDRATQSIQRPVGSVYQQFFWVVSFHFDFSTFGVLEKIDTCIEI